MIYGNSNIYSGKFFKTIVYAYANQYGHLPPNKTVAINFQYFFIGAIQIGNANIKTNILIYLIMKSARRFPYN